MLSAILLSAACLAQDPLSPLERQVPFFSLEVSPVAELWCEVRHLAGVEGEIPDGPLAASARAMRAVDPLLASQMMWGPVDAVGVAAEPGAWLAVHVPLPKRMIAEGHTRKQLKGALEVLFAELDSAAASWLEAEWPAREAALGEQRATLAEALNPRAAEQVWDRIERWLTLRRPERPFPVILVTRSAPPGGVTVLSPSGPTSLVATEGRGTSLQAEVVLHELMHALETNPANPPPLFTEVAKYLTFHQVRNPAVKREWVHTVYFLAAAELVRSVIDPEHVDWGVSEGYYAEVEEVHAAIAPLWRRYVDGELGRTPFCDAVGATARETRDR